MSHISKAFFSSASSHTQVFLAPDSDRAVESQGRPLGFRAKAGPMEKISTYPTKFSNILLFIYKKNFNYPVTFYDAISRSHLHQNPKNFK